MCSVYVFQYIIFVNIVFHETSKRVMPRSRPSFSEFYLYDYDIVVIYFFILWYIISNCLCTCYSKILEYFFFICIGSTLFLHMLILCIHLFSAYTYSLHIYNLWHGRRFRTEIGGVTEQTFLGPKFRKTFKEKFPFRILTFLMTSFSHCHVFCVFWCILSSFSTE